MDVLEEVFSLEMQLDRERSCIGKVRHDTEWQAASAAKDKGLSWYYCKWCDGWHLTSAKRH